MDRKGGRSVPSVPRILTLPPTLSVPSHFLDYCLFLPSAALLQLFLTSYPDEDEDYRSIVGGRARSTFSAATTGRLVPQGNDEKGHTKKSKELGDLPRTRIVDALGRPGAGGRHRRRRGAGRIAVGRPLTIRNAISQEEKSELAAASSNGGGVSAPLAPVVNKSWGVSASASEMMSGMQDDSTIRSGMSGIRGWGGRRPARSGLGARSAISGMAPSEVPSVWKNLHEDDITPNDAADANDPGLAKLYVDEMEVDTTICCGEWALWKPKTIAHAWDKLLEIAEPDTEMKRIIRLAIPFTLSTVSEAFFDAVAIVVFNRWLGPETVIAYVVVSLMIGLTDTFIGGIIDAEGTICAHAYGAGNNFLAGQYVQIAVVIYTLCHLPFLIMWVFVMKDVIAAFGFNENVQVIGAEYTKVLIFTYIVEGLSSAFSVILDITGHEWFGLILDIVHNFVDLGGTLIVVILIDGATLTMVGFVELVICSIFFAIMMSWSIWKGWFADFWGGMLGGF